MLSSPPTQGSETTPELAGSDVDFAGHPVHVFFRSHGRRPTELTFVSPAHKPVITSPIFVHETECPTGRQHARRVTSTHFSSKTCYLAVPDPVVAASGTHFAIKEVANFRIEADMWNWLNCYLSGRHDFGVTCSSGSIFLSCRHCGKRSNGWAVHHERTAMVRVRRESRVSKAPKRCVRCRSIRAKARSVAGLTLPASLTIRRGAGRISPCLSNASVKNS